MKKTLLFLAVALLAACGPKTQTQTPDQTEELTQAQEATGVVYDDPTYDEIIALVKCIPDHTFEYSPAWAFTPEYYAALKEAWEIPSDGFGDIGSEEWLYYFLTGQDGAGMDNFGHIISVNTNGDTSVVDFDYNLYDDEIVPHKLILKHDDERWRIAEFDDTYSKLIEYVKQLRAYFRSDESRETLESIVEEGWLSDSDVEDIVAELNRYFDNYPDDITCANK